MSATALALFIVGLAMVVAGADVLVRGAARLAGSFGVSPLVIGLTVVAYGTSAPELSVSFRAGLSGSADIAVGNVVGSNIYNVLLILGLSSLVTPLVVSLQLIRRDVPLMIGISLVLWVMSRDGVVGRLDGGLLVAGAVVYSFHCIRQSRRQTRRERAVRADDDVTGRPRKGPSGWLLHLVYVLVGLAMLVVGSGWVTQGAVQIARLAGVSELTIALTIVAMGTSLPEAATSITAALRGERDIAVGNVVGSNIFNILTVAGLTATVAPRGLAVAPQAVSFDMPVMVAVSVACLPIFATGHRISRWEGLVFVLYGVVYTVFLVWMAVREHVPSTREAAVAVLVALLPAVTLVVLAERLWKARKQPTDAPEPPSPA